MTTACYLIQELYDMHVIHSPMPSQSLNAFKNNSLTALTHARSIIITMKVQEPTISEGKCYLTHLQ